MILNVLVLQIEPPKDDSSVETVVLDPKLTTFEERSEKLAIVLEELRKKDVFFTLKGWRDEVMTAVSSKVFLIKWKLIPIQSRFSEMGNSKILNVSATNFQWLMQDFPSPPPPPAR